MPRRGENIYKRKDWRWEGRYIKEHINKKIKYGYVYARTYKEVKEKLCKISNIIPDKEIPALPALKLQSCTTFKTVALSWLSSLKPQLKESSIVKYTNVLAVNLFPYFGSCNIESVTREDVISFSNKLLFSGGKKGTGLSPKTVNSIISVLKGIFIYASQHEKLAVADISRISIKQPQKAMRILSITEQQKLSMFLCDNLTLINLGILVCLYTGIRIGEICALKWQDISFDEKYLYVDKTMQRIQNQGNSINKTSILISEPKSGCSIRRIPLPDNIFKLVLSARCPGNTYFLTGQAGTFVEPRSLQNHFKSAIRACNIKDANFHALRHTFATRCIELGFDVKSLSEILGHASVNITLNRYVHPSMELKQKNMNMLSELLTVK